ncbi:MAG TPA: hypothetical protein VGH98_14265 [Gemmatimonadaceae bacterium]|jgi:hypothetical protein
MTDHPSDDFDEMLRSAAQDYNRPGETPRERMWTEIRAARARRATAVAPSIGPRRLWVIPFAAAAMLVIGIAIGRLYERRVPKTEGARVALNRPESTSTPPTSPVVVDSNPKVHSMPSAPHPTPRVTPNTAPNTVDVPRSQPFNDHSENMAYRLAVMEHLAGTEAMLTSFRSAAKRGEVDAQITTWAKNLLTTTRLLEASAQEDPTMKRLLDDLELVLVQIAQYSNSGAHHAEELDLIEHSIERRGVIGKLHTTIPARLSPAGT